MKITINLLDESYRGKRVDQSHRSDPSVIVDYCVGIGVLSCLILCNIERKGNALKDVDSSRVQTSWIYWQEWLNFFRNDINEGLETSRSPVFRCLNSHLIGEAQAQTSR